tara:strand:- start:8112 stop:8243 length:132 start_codon:yes stop_codon:yes gene_type:complete
MKILCLLSVILISLSTIGCNTVEGLGKDIKKGGEAIQKSAEKA